MENNYEPLEASEVSEIIEQIPGIIEQNPVIKKRKSNKNYIMYSMLTILIILMIGNLVFNFVFIYYPIVKYHKKIEVVVDNIDKFSSSVDRINHEMNKIDTFIAAAAPVLKNLAKYLCKYVPSSC